MADPIGDAERAEFREIAVVEHQHEQAVLGADALDRVAEPAREIPDVAGMKVDDLRLALRVDGGDAALALDHIGPPRWRASAVRVTPQGRATSARRRSPATPGNPRSSPLSPSRRPRFWGRPRRAGSGRTAARRRPAAPVSARTAAVLARKSPYSLQLPPCRRPRRRPACRDVRIRSFVTSWDQVPVPIAQTGVTGPNRESTKLGMPFAPEYSGSTRPDPYQMEAP